MRTIVVAGLALTAACAPMAGTGEASADAPATAPGKCDAGLVQDLVGKPASAVQADAMKRSGARTIRVYKTGDAVTMDYREDRLNVETDAGGMIVKLGCG